MLAQVAFDTGTTPSIEKYGLPDGSPKRLATSHSFCIASGGGKYQRWPWSKYFRVAALLTPQASFARLRGRPVRFHSSSNQCLSCLPRTRASYTYCTHTSVTTGKRRIFWVFTLPAMWEAPLFQVLEFT